MNAPFTLMVMDVIDQVMKLVTLLKRNICIVVLSLLITPGFAQNSGKSLQKIIVIKESRVSIDSLLKIFSRHTGIEFSFNSNKISSSKKITVSKQKQTVAQWLQVLKQQLNVDYKLVGNHIILMDGRNKNSLPQKNGFENKSNLKSATTPVKQNKETIDLSASNKFPLNNNTNLQRTDTSFKASTNRSVIDNDSTQKINQANSSKTKMDSIPNQIIRVGDTALTTAKQPGTATEKDKKERRVREPVENEPLHGITKIDLGVQGVGISFEAKIFRNTIIDFSAGVGGGYAVTGEEFKYKFVKRPNIYLSINPRLYFGRNKRAEKGKVLSANSGNYIGARLKYVTDRFSENFTVWDVILFNVHLGAQRKLSRRWLVNGHAGAGIGVARYEPSLWRAYPSLELKFSYMFKPRD